MDRSLVTIDRSPRPVEPADVPSIVVVTDHGLPADPQGAWDAYVATTPGATFFHRLGWLRAVWDQYGHRPHCLVARESAGGRIRGVLPLGMVSGPLTGRALISVPYAVSGGAVADDAAIEAQLVTRARQEADRLGVGYLELRHPTAGESLSRREHYFGFRTTLPADPEAVLGRFPRKARAEVRKARDLYKLTARFGHDLLETFYHLYVLSLRRLGSPAHSRRFLQRLVAEFSDDCLVQVVEYQGRPVAGVLSFRFRDTILPYYAGIDDRFYQMNVSNYLYFSLMEQAVRLGLRVFDFGRTRRDNVGGCQFKINQGFEPEPMIYSYYSPTGQEPPDLRPSNAAFSRSQAIWQRLPRPVAGMLGGLVSRWLP